MLLQQAAKKGAPAQATKKGEPGQTGRSDLAWRRSTDQLVLRLDLHLLHGSWSIHHLPTHLLREQSIRSRNIAIQQDITGPTQYHILHYSDWMALYGMFDGALCMVHCSALYGVLCGALCGALYGTP